MCTGGGYGGGQGQGMPQWGRPQNISDGPGRMGGMGSNSGGYISTGQIHPGSPEWDRMQASQNDPNWLENYRSGLLGAFGGSQMPQKPGAYNGSYGQIPNGPGVGGMDGNKMGIMQNLDPRWRGGAGPMGSPMMQNPYSGARIGSTVGSQMMGMPEQGQYPQNPYKGGGAQESIFGQGYTPMSSQGQYNPQMQQLMQAMMGPRMMSQTSQVPQQAQGQIQPGWNGGY